MNPLADHWGKSPVELPADTLDLSPVRLDLPSLVQLLYRMPPQQVYVRVPGLEPGSGQPPRVALDAVPDLATRVRDPAPMHVLAVELQDHDAGCAEVLSRFKQRIAAWVPEMGAPLKRCSMGLFLSTPGVLAPFHADQEHNFLCQVHGRKKMHMFDTRDHATLTSEARERLAVHDIHALDTYRAELESEATVAQLEPGTVLYHPPFSPHWVDTGKDDYSLSLSFTFITPSLDKLLLLHKINHQLRKLGLAPGPVGRSPRVDGMKTAAARGLRSLKRVVSP